MDNSVPVELALEIASIGPPQKETRLKQERFYKRLNKGFVKKRRKKLRALSEIILATDNKPLVDKIRVIERALLKEGITFAKEFCWDKGMQMVLLKIARPLNNEHILGMRITAQESVIEAEIVYNWSKEIPEWHCVVYDLLSCPEKINDIVSVHKSVCQHCKKKT